MEVETCQKSGFKSKELGKSFGQLVFVIRVEGL